MGYIRRYMPQIFILTGCILAALIYLGATSSEAKADDETTVLDVPGVEAMITDPAAEKEEGFMSKFVRGYKAASTDDVDVLHRMAELDKREADLTSKQDALQTWEEQLDQKNYRVMADRGKLLGVSSSLEACVDEAMAKYNQADMSAESRPPVEDVSDE